jgi:hypothetical protein
MSIFVTTCPQCSAERIALDVKALHRKGHGRNRVFVYTLCPACDKPSAFTLVHGGGAMVTEDWFFSGSVQKNTDILSDSGWTIAEFIPPQVEADAPDHTPPEISRALRQAKSAHRRRELDGAAMLYRKTLELAVKKLDPDGKGMLDARIKALSKSDMIPQAVAEWAHEIKGVGNEAAHDAEEPSIEDVDASAEFVEAFLTYAFTMPTKISNRKSKDFTDLLG